MKTEVNKIVPFTNPLQIVKNQKTNVNDELKTPQITNEKKYLTKDGTGASVQEIKNIIASSVNKNAFEKQNEVISFDEYLNRVIENPKLIRTSTQRIFDMVMSKGREISLIDGETLYRYNFFSNPVSPDDAIAGIEKPLHQLMEKIEGSANASGPDKRIIFLVGPVGSAKTTIVRTLKEGLEAYTRSDEGALFSTQWDLRKPNGEALFSDLPIVKNCDVHDDPFKLLPNDAGSNVREKIVTALNNNLKETAKADNKTLPYQLHSKGDACPSCKDIYDRLYKHYNGDVSEVLKHAKAKRILLDEDARVGITTYEPRDEKSHDVEQLTGSVNLRKLIKSGNDSDPQSFNFDGELALSNRGIAHFDELLKLPRQMLYVLLTAAQDRKYKATKFAQIAFDGLLIGTSNIPDWDKIRKDKHSEAIRSRIIEIPVPYNGKIDDEVKIYSKSFVKSAIARNIHISPHTVWIASLWATMTRLAETKGDITMLQKALLYNGEQIKDYNPYKVLQLKRDIPVEAMELLKGVSPRNIENALSSAMSHPDVTHEQKGSNCISPYLVLDCLEKELNSGVANITPQERESYKAFLKEVETELDNSLKKDVHRAIAGNEQGLENIFNAYKRNVFAWKKKEQVLNPITSRMDDPEKDGTMKAIEDKLEITDGSRSEYRSWFIEQFALAPEGKPFTYKSDTKFRKALEDVLVEKHSDITISLPNVSKDTASAEEQKQFKVIKSRLTEKFGYCEHCSEIAISQASSPKNRGSVRR